MKKINSYFHLFVQFFSIVVLLPVSPFFFIAWNRDKKRSLFFLNIGRLRIEFFRAFSLSFLTGADYYIAQIKK